MHQEKYRKKGSINVIQFSTPLPAAREINFSEKELIRSVLKLHRRNFHIYDVVLSKV